MAEKRDSGGFSLADRVLESPFTWLITAINLGVFMIAWFSGETRGQGLSPETLLQFGATERMAIWSGEHWRFASAVVLHVGWVHLLWNTYGMFGWCAAVERAIGSWRFTVAYAVSGIGGAGVSVLGHDALSAGASGAGFGMIGVTLCLLWRRAGSLHGFLEDPAVKQQLVGIAVWTILGLVAVPMDHYAHFGGLGFGILAGTVFTARRLQKRPGLQAAGMAGLVLLLSGTLLAAAYPQPGITAMWGAQRAFDAGVEALDRGDHEAAIRDLEAAERLGLVDPALYYNRGLARRARGDTGGAGADFRTALECAPAGWSGRAAVESELKRIEATLEGASQERRNP